MQTIQIENLFNSFSTFKVLIIGDIMIDSYLWGDVNRISPEAPVPIVACNKRENRLGGAANVALNINETGAEAILCSIVGNDDKAKIINDLLKENNLSNIGIITDSQRRTTIKFRVISSGQHLLRVDEEDIFPLSENIETIFIKNIEHILETNNINSIIFEDYDKGTITANVIEKIVGIANLKKIPTLVDPKKRNFNFYKNVTLFKPNFKEFTEGLKLEIPKNDFETIFKASQEFIKSTANSIVMTTLSELGIFISDQKSYFRVPAEIRDISDVSGAGDTVISIASLCVASGLDIHDIAVISNLAGGLVCEKVGVVPIDIQQLKMEVLRYYSL